VPTLAAVLKKARLDRIVELGRIRRAHGGAVRHHGRADGVASLSNVDAIVTDEIEDELAAAIMANRPNVVVAAGGN
jgi:hypothetical protein